MNGQVTIEKLAVNALLDDDIHLIEPGPNKTESLKPWNSNNYIQKNNKNRIKQRITISNSFR